MPPAIRITVGLIKGTHSLVLRQFKVKLAPETQFKKVTGYEALDIRRTDHTGRKLIYF
jgi:hypothetical protein